MKKEEEIMAQLTQLTLKLSTLTVFTVVFYPTSTLSAVLLALLSVPKIVDRDYKNWSYLIVYFLNLKNKLLYLKITLW